VRCGRAASIPRDLPHHLGQQHRSLTADPIEYPASRDSTRARDRVGAHHLGCFAKPLRLIRRGSRDAQSLRGRIEATTMASDGREEVDS
jgi:hypothetical protein